MATYTFLPRSVVPATLLYAPHYPHTAAHLRPPHCLHPTRFTSYLPDYTHTHTHAPPRTAHRTHACSTLLVDMAASPWRYCGRTRGSYRCTANTRTVTAHGDNISQTYSRAKKISAKEEGRHRHMALGSRHGARACSRQHIAMAGISSNALAGRDATPHTHTPLAFG